MTTENNKRTEIYFEEAHLMPEKGDSWAFYDGIFHFDGNSWKRGDNYRHYKNV